MKLTPWFAGDVRPVHVGVYNRELYYSQATYSYWNGEYWSTSCDTVERAYQFKDTRSYNQIAPWRGIIKLENNS